MMSSSYSLVTGIIVLLLFLWYLSFTASRLDRLHHRVETSWASLDALLQQRAALALEVTHRPEVDPAVAMVLVQSSYLAQEADIAERSQAEEGLASTIGLLYETEEFHTKNPDLSARMSNVGQKIEMAIRLHTEAVQTTQQQRSRPLVKIFRLAGRAPLPILFPFELRSGL